MPPTYLQADRPFPPFSLSLSLYSCRGNEKLKKSQPGKGKAPHSQADSELRCKLQGEKFVKFLLNKQIHVKALRAK